MIDETIYKIALAGYFHDIGKFAERAKAKEGDNKGFFVDILFIDRNSSLYQPIYGGKLSHSHAVYTAAFIDHIEGSLPLKFNKNQWGLGDSFVNLAAGHHKPETPFQWIIAIADRISSGFDRAEFEEKYNKEINVRDYKKTRLLTIFERISLENRFESDRLEDYRYRYPLKELSPENIFPVDDITIRQIDGKEAEEEYKELFSNFIIDLTNLSHKENIPLWFEHFDSLFMIYASHVPAATVGYVVPDVSLYDHCRITSAIASALYQYHKETNTMTTEAIRNYEEKKFLLVSGDFYGIQDFIFTEGGSTGKASAKLLRGRSFYVSLLSELAADMLCKELGLPITSIILNAAGKFTILAHNTEKARQTVSAVENHINEWLIKKFFGQASIGLSMVEASPDDFTSERFIYLWEKLSQAVEKKKFSKFDITKHGGCLTDYLDSFDSAIGVCPFCNKRPAQENVSIRDIMCCNICHDHAYIGENLVKEDRIAITTIEADLEKEKLLEPIFGKYQLSFKVTGKLNQLAREGSLLRYWDIGIKHSGKIAKDITAKFINGYVPKYDEDDFTDIAINKILSGKKTDKTKEELFDSMEVGIPKTFFYIAKTSLNETSKTGKFKGIEALGILKADVDNLGLLFACGMKKERLTLSRLATMSRQLNNYFSIYIPYILKTDGIFKNIYTVFSGGDDLFLIGPWNKVIEFVIFLNDSFKKYVCQNPTITISAGISIHKPNDPVIRLAETADRSLEKSKVRGRNRITIFHETAEWADFMNLNKIRETLERWLNSEKINNAMLFRLNELIEMKRQEQELINSGLIYMEDMECLKWRARLKYTIIRNVGRNLRDDKKQEAINEVMKVVEWIEKYGGTLRIPLWQVIYNNRKGGVHGY